MNFTKIDNPQDPHPIVLIDNSGSTSCQMYFQNENKTNRKKTVLDQEIRITCDILKNRKIESFYLMLWNSGVSFPFKNELVPLESFDSFKAKSNGCTDLSAPLRALPETWYKDKKITDLYIVTDGEINGADPRQLLRKYINLNFRIHIITVEPNNSNYVNDNCQAGNTIYHTLNSECLMKNVREFISYNLLYLDGFTSIDNPSKVAGYYTFRGQYFPIDQVTQFIKYLETLVQETRTKETQIKGENQGNQTLKLIHEISYTVSQMIEEQPLTIKKGIINMISKLFINTPLYKEARKLLLGEAENIQKGKATTFQDYRRNRTRVFEKAQMSLFQSVADSIVAEESDQYSSFLINDSILIGSKDQITGTIHFKKDNYNQAAFVDGNYAIPILPTEVIMDHGEVDQCLRQWIRANYARLHDVNAAADQILYYFLTDTLRVHLSDIDPKIKKTWTDMARVMLDRVRFGTSNKEYVYLLDNNPPAPVTGSPDGIISILKKCLDMVGLDSDLIAPMTLWYAIIMIFGDESLERAQIKFCQEDLQKNNFEGNLDHLHPYLKSKFKPVKSYNLDDSIEVDYEYYCYITNTNTADNGGWTFKKHSITENLSCDPKYVLSYTAYASNETIRCPLCMTSIPKKDMIFVQPKKNIENDLRAQRGIQEKPAMNHPIYDLRNHIKVEIGPSIYKSDDDHTLTKLDDLDFKVQSYQINAPTINDALGNRQIEITNQVEFNQVVHTKYPFLKDLDMTGACLAGGFCRSVLLKQRLKDLDFFFYGYGQSETDHKIYLQNFKNLLNNICIKVKEWKPEAKFMIMYKPLFNVFEVVCVSDPTNFLEQEYCLDNFKQYDFKSLHRYDKHTLIDPETGKVYRRKNRWDQDEEDTSMQDIENRDFSNYFEDGDVTGIRMLLRIQFILAKFKTKEDIMNSFDMYPCRVIYDGQSTYFTKKSYQAYKYMINVVNENNYSDLYDHRLSKYFIYGFSIVLPELDMKKVKKNRNITISGLKFKVNGVNGQLITVEKNSQIKRLLDSLQSVEKKNADKGKALYKSAIFCSLVSLLRYVKINDINYLFTDQIVLPDQSNQMKFRESTAQIHFIDKISSRKLDQDLYGYFRLGHQNDNLSSHLLDSSDSEEDEEPETESEDET